MDACQFLGFKVFSYKAFGRMNKAHPNETDFTPISRVSRSSIITRIKGENVVKKMTAHFLCTLKVEISTEITAIIHLI